MSLHRRRARSAPAASSAPAAPARDAAASAPARRDARGDDLAHRGEQVVPFPLRVAAGIGWRVIVVAVVAWGLIQVFAATSTVVIPVAIGLLLTALLMPLAVFLNHRLRIPRHGASGLAVVVSLLVVIGLAVLAGEQVVSGFADLGTSVSEGLNEIQNWLATGPLQLGGEQLSQLITQGRDWLQQNARALTSGVLSAGVTAGAILVGAVIALVVTFFFLADGDRIWAWCVRLLPDETQEPTHQAFRRGWVTLGSYVRTQVLVAALDAVGISLGALILGLPLIVPIGLIVFLASAIPIAGAIASGAIVVILALVVKGIGPAVIMLLVVLLVNQLEGNVLQPVLMSKSVALHPLATLLGVAVGSYLLGVVGALFAVPIMAVTNTVALYLRGHDKFPRLVHGSVLGNSPRKLAGGDKDLVPIQRADGQGARWLGQADPAFLARSQHRSDEQAAAQT